MADYKVVRMRRRTISISVDKDLNTIVKAPFSVSSVFIENFVNRHEEFIEKAKRIRSDEIDFFSEYEHENMIRQLKSKGREYIPARLSYFSDITGFVPVSWRITRAKTRFGSCSGTNRLSFSCYLFAYPEKAIDYVLLHELCHIKHKNHSGAFYSEIEKYMPDYKERKKLLKEYPIKKLYNLPIVHK